MSLETVSGAHLDEYARTLETERKMVPRAYKNGDGTTTYEEWPETDEELRDRLRMLGATQPQAGSVGSIIYMVEKVLPAGIGLTYSQKKSRKVKRGTVHIHIVEHDPRPWWKFWGRA